MVRLERYQHEHIFVDKLVFRLWDKEKEYLPLIFRRSYTGNLYSRLRNEIYANFASIEYSNDVGVKQ